MPDKLSKMPEVKVALLAAFQAEPGLADVTIQRGVIDPPQLEQIEIFEGTTTREYRAMRPPVHPIRERMSITIRVTGMASAQVSIADAEDRSWAIADSLDGAVRGDATLADLVEFCALERAEQRFWRFDNFRGSVITVTFTATATFD